MLVKWYESGEGKLVLFKQFDINPDDRNFVSIYREQGMIAGDYTVEVYRVNQAVDLLFAGHYAVR